jgi:hypothetical protein
MDWIAFLWFAGALVPLLLLERWIHRHLQGVGFLLVGDLEVAAWFYALPLLPGVALHEFSHALAGWLLGAQVGRISLMPARAEGRIQLGFVPVEKTGAVKTALIGLAPLVTGCLALLLIGHLGLHLSPLAMALATGNWPAVPGELRQITQTPNAWVWIYLAFAISNTMLPSRSDLRAWPVIVLFLVGVAGAVALLGLGLVVVERLTDALRWLAVACGLTVLIDLPFVVLLLALEWFLGRVKGVRIEYG